MESGNDESILPIITLALTQNRAATWALDDITRDPKKFVSTLCDPSVSNQIPLSTRRYVLALLASINAYSPAVSFALKSLSIKSRPVNECIPDFLTFCVAGSLLAIQRFFVGEEGVNEADVLGKYDREASHLICKCEELLGGGGEISALLCLGGDPKELTLLPFQTQYRRTNLLKENAGMTEANAKAFVLSAALKVTTLNAVFNLVLAYVKSSTDSNNTDDILDCLEKAAILFEAVRSKKPHQPGVDLGFAALSASQGDWGDVIETLKKESKKRKREGSDTFIAAVNETIAYANIMSGKYDEVMEDPTMRVTEIASLTRDVDLEKWTYSTTPETCTPASLLTLSDALFIGGQVELSQSLLEFMAPYCLRPTKQRRLDPGLNKKALLSEYFFQRGRIFHTMQEDDTAAEEYRAALSNNPALHAARLGLIRCLGSGSTQVPLALTHSGPLARRFPSTCLATHKEIAMKSFLLTAADADPKGQTEILELIREPDQDSGASDLELLRQKRFKLSTLSTLLAAGVTECCQEAYETLRDILCAAAKEAPRKAVPGEVTASNEQISKDEDSTNQSAQQEPPKSDVHMVNICLKRKSVPVEYCVSFAHLLIGIGKVDEACRVLNVIRAYLKAESAQYPLEQVTLAYLGALFTAGNIDELHSRIKRISGDKTSRLSRRKEFGILRALSYAAKGDLKFARALCERLLSVLFSELVSTGGRDNGVWEAYLEAMELAMLCRAGISSDPFHDKTKELVERALKKEGQRLSDDPSAVPMPTPVKSRVTTLSGWLALERGLRRKFHEKRSQQTKSSEPSAPQASAKHFQEARESGRSAVSLDPSNWRAYYLIGRASRELDQASVAARIYRLMAESLAQRLHPSQRQHMEMALLREGTMSLAAARKPHSTHTTKLQKSLTAVLAIQPDDFMYLVDVADVVVDGTLAAAVVPFFARVMSQISGEPTLLAQYAFASLRTKELLSKSKNLDSIKNPQVINTMLEEAQIVVEMYEKLIREKTAAKKLQMDRRVTDDVPQKLSFAQLKARDFPITSISTQQMAACPPPPPLRELERLPKDETLRRLLDRQIIPLLRRLRGMAK
eukprot:Blabericola_migrator_1__3898@NODE_217_length_11276_cov_60_022660_g184_i0_p1_GENE_NODE_217_length_11276_cov_60_022660_g184_i0NODE_217_length_11276_cov_60_022660_g184_i0_p1_ORF_typecomplete_len1082_score267_61TPR_15/PF13429_6/3_9e02TPR_15/PF13429_6/0_2TPR_15/PF13429_6/1_3TPR_15/PF13429_6/5_4TPR_15/PF13429_6/1_4e02TPR_16/PF13432_6/7_6e02TPR_16/PF13432_6/0_29TPR_16/PF13432_6/9_7e03TPR_16/PF13432_6/21TPR_16/PF13432_6/0_001TPR_19/PF14559_6/2_1e02TPR_19/PF14559_6/0_29TPR_19/PF14559_6/1_3e03TPR_19/PF145